MEKTWWDATKSWFRSYVQEQGRTAPWLQASDEIGGSSLAWKMLPNYKAYAGNVLRSVITSVPIEVTDRTQFDYNWNRELALTRFLDRKNKGEPLFGTELFPKEGSVNTVQEMQRQLGLFMQMYRGGKVQDAQLKPLEGEAPHQWGNRVLDLINAQTDQNVLTSDIKRDVELGTWIHEPETRAGADPQTVHDIEQMERNQRVWEEGGSPEFVPWEQDTDPAVEQLLAPNPWERSERKNFFGVG